jgi:hypothetical protein
MSDDWPTMPSFADELLARFRLDKEARDRYVELNKQSPPSPDIMKAAEEMRRIDADNLAWLRDHFDRHGWPPKSIIGDEASEAAFMIVQHAVADPGFQQRALDAIEALGPLNEVNPWHFAYLSDRIRRQRGESQRYGTQCFKHPEAGWMCDPCEDPENLDARRRSVGLEPIADYLRLIAKTFD